MVGVKKTKDGTTVVVMATMGNYAFGGTLNRTEGLVWDVRTGQCILAENGKTKDMCLEQTTTS